MEARNGSTAFFRPIPSSKLFIIIIYLCFHAFVEITCFLLPVASCLTSLPYFVLYQVATLRFFAARLLCFEFDGGSFQFFVASFWFISLCNAKRINKQTRKNGAKNKQSSFGLDGSENRIRNTCLFSVRRNLCERARAGTLVSLISIHYIRACEWCRYLLLFLEMRNWKKIKRFAVIELPEGNIPSQPVLWTARPSHSATANCRSWSLMIHSLCFVIRATLRDRSAQFHYDVCMCSAPHCFVTNLWVAP